MQHTIGVVANVFILVSPSLHPEMHFNERPYGLHFMVHGGGMLALLLSAKSLCKLGFLPCPETSVTTCFSLYSGNPRLIEPGSSALLSVFFFLCCFLKLEKTLAFPRGSNYSIFKVLGPNNYSEFGLWGQRPQILVTWTFWG